MKQSAKDKHGWNVNQTLTGYVDNQGFHSRATCLESINQNIKHTKQKAGVKKNMGK